MKKYISPEMEIIVFSTEDVITTSLVLDDKPAGNGNDDITEWV